ncbi:TonB-linked SusC/RagA family outer membrane protein [Dinghuibacter silviterrae]|uniref:TonB-linked SusC/RagA family outer membrane protein n=2 Tax=Dinghuibacter silviterrae TaxID=1539049 RepID=A0A4R8DF78_9BACT|nr:TonB-linked SusC/RagA family outer membrane protein [Dinghuibacter silviterrae]
MVILAALCLSLKAQQSAQVKGSVMSERNEFLHGVTVKVDDPSGKPVATVLTDEKGVFTVKVLQAGTRYDFSFSYVGFEPKKVKGFLVNAGENNAFLVRMKPQTADMSEVIVVGYGTAKKIDVTGAVDQISGKEVDKRPVANVFEGLQGLSPGLNITYSGGAPGKTPTFNIRGIGSINGGSPLIVIDGIAGTSDDLLRLNPSDIASFSILRDAASAAIYGARAAFGVIIVTTKEGAKGKQVISYNAYVSSSKPTVLPDPVTDPYIYARILQESTDNTPWQYIKFSDYQYQWAKDRSDDPSIAGTRLDPNNPTQWTYMGNNNWYDYFFNHSSMSFNHSLSISGSGETAKKLPFGYYLSADYTKENGLDKLAKDDWERYAIKARVNFSPLKWLKLDNNLNIYQTITSNPSTALTDVYYLRPIDQAVNPDGTWANSGPGTLAAQLVDGGRNQQNVFGFQNIARATASFLNGDLQLTGDASVKMEQWKYNDNYNPYYIGYGPNDIREEGAPGSVTEKDGTLINDIYDVYANYNKVLGKHSIRLLAGYNQESYTYSTVQSERDGLITASLPYIGLTTGTNYVTPTYDAYATRSYFGRIGYSYMDRYILELNGRYDGSSRFPAADRWGFFPSVSGAWNVSKEGFFRKALNYVSTFKLRASYGSLGNQNVSSFGYMQELTTGLSPTLINGALQTVVEGAPALSVDPNNYTWEKVSTTNVGTDIGMLKDKVQVSFDYFVRNTTGMLGPTQPLPAVLGTSAPMQNSADMRTKGWEGAISYRDVYRVGNKPLGFGLRFTLSDSRSVITKYDNPQELFSNYRQGEQLGELWGLTNMGLFKSTDEIAKLDESAIVPWGALAIVPGWPKYKDLDGNQKIEVGLSAKDPKDLRIIGNTSPRFLFGFNINADYRGFDFSAFFQGVGKMDWYPHNYLYWGPFQQPYAGLYKWNLNFYRGTAESPAQRAGDSKSYIAAGLADQNLNSKYPVLESWLADNNYGAGLDIPQTGYLLNAAYLRVKNVTIGYTLPASMTNSYKISRLRFYFSGENLFEFSRIKQYVDPEAVNATNAFAYPFQRKYALGLNLDF